MLIVSYIKRKFLNVEFKILQYRISKHNYNIVRKPTPGLSSLVVKNVFKTQYEKNALISYLVSPFIDSINFSHSNFQECLLIAEILQKLNYNVDVINWDNHEFRPEISYDLVIDNNNNLERLKFDLPKHCFKIFHATNTNWLYQNAVEYNRHRDFFLKTGIPITPPRQNLPGNSFMNCDVITMFGNDFTKNTYGLYADKICHLPMTITSIPSYKISRNYTKTKFNFIWLNSHGALLKGLDIIIDLFLKIPNCNLYVCGNLEVDSQFYNFYKNSINQSGNIHVLGWVDIQSNYFQTISDKCTWVISTSFSEGGGGSILNCMAKGLIPIVSPSVSLNISSEMGFYVDNGSVDSLKHQIESLLNLPDSRLKELSMNCIDFILQNHTKKNFIEKFTSLLQTNIPN
jgi:glycosyltransferase involved in cell wall biosynthesis